MIDAELIDANDTTRAKRGSLRSPEFRRMVRLAWPHRRLLAVGMVAALIYGALHSVSIVAILPALSVMVSDEGLHGWVDRRVAEHRLGARLDARYGGGDDAPRLERLLVSRMNSNSPLAEIDAIHAIVGVGDTPLTDPSTLHALATSEGEVELQFVTGTGVSEPSTRQVALRQASWDDRALLTLAARIPVPPTRADRVNSLIWVLALVVLTVVLSNLARFVAQYFVSVGVLRSVMDLRKLMYRKVLRLPMDFFSESTSDTVSRFVQDMQEVQRGLLALFGKLFREPIKAVFVLAAALTINTRLTVTLLLVGPFIVILFWAIGRKIRKANNRLLRTYGEMIGALSTTLDAIGIVKAYNAENSERRRLWRIDRRMFKFQLKIVGLEAFLRPMLEVMAVVAIAGVVVWLGGQVLRGELDLAEFGTVLIALGMLLDPLRKFADVYPRVMRSTAGAQRIFAVLDLPAEQEVHDGAVELPPMSDSISIHDVSFTYANASLPALQDVSLTINHGETIALVGPNGSGKTTLTKLLLRYHDPQQGTIVIDGVDIQDASLRSLRRQFSLVTQDPVVFAMSIAENIAYGGRQYSDDDIERAARLAHAKEFIGQKQDGLAEQVGQRGSMLSGGQRQRLCIARAILRDAPVLIFDEATSQVDSESEQLIQEAIRDFSRDRTTILIAHRLSTIRFASRIVVFDSGQIVDTGRHEELLERCPLYQTLCRSQLAHH